MKQSTHEPLIRNNLHYTYTQSFFSSWIFLPLQLVFVFFSNDFLSIFDAFIFYIKIAWWRGFRRGALHFRLIICQHS